MLFYGSKERVDWYFLIDHTRRIDYAVMYLCKHLIYLILAFCLLFPKDILRDTKVFIFIFTVWDLVHYFATSHIGFELFKWLLVLATFLVYKRFKK